MIKLTKLLEIAGPFRGPTTPYKMSVDRARGIFQQLKPDVDFDAFYAGVNHEFKEFDPNTGAELRTLINKVINHLLSDPMFYSRDVEMKPAPELSTPSHEREMDEQDGMEDGGDQIDYDSMGPRNRYDTSTSNYMALDHFDPEHMPIQEAERDYKREYALYHAKPEQKKRRAQRNHARRKMTRLGHVKKGDGKDVHHTSRDTSDNSSKNLRVMEKSKNRSIK
jgi:hypothetical protein